MSEAATKLTSEEQPAAQDSPAAAIDTNPEPPVSEVQPAAGAPSSEAQPPPAPLDAAENAEHGTAAGDAPKANGKSDFTQDAITFMRKSADTLRKGADSFLKGAEEARKGAKVLIEKSKHISIQTPSWAVEPFRGPTRFTPRADFSMNALAYEIAVELPGLEEKNVHVKLSEGQVSVSGEKTNGATEDSGTTYFVQERQYGRFERSFRIPNDVDPAKIEARFERNVLKIVMPKYPEAKVPVREIEVKSS